MQYIKSYELFESDGTESSEGLCLFMKAKIKGGGESVVVLMSSGSDLTSASNKMISGLKSNKNVDSLRRFLSLFGDPDFLETILEGRIEEVYELIPYKTQPKIGGEIPSFDYVICDFKDPKGFDPMNMKNSDDEDSIVSPGWDTDDILSKLYGMFKSDRPLFYRIALGKRSNIDNESILGDLPKGGFEYKPDHSRKAKANKMAIKRGMGDLGIIRRSIGRKII